MTDTDKKRNIKRHTPNTRVVVPMVEVAAKLIEFYNQEFYSCKLEHKTKAGRQYLIKREDLKRLLKTPRLRDGLLDELMTELWQHKFILIDLDAEFVVMRESDLPKRLLPSAMIVD